jgi:hypothetical protein
MTRRDGGGAVVAAATAGWADGRARWCMSPAAAAAGLPADQLCKNSTVSV